MPENYCCVTDFACAAIFFCTLQYIVRQRAYVIYDAIICNKRPLLRLRPLPSNNELSAVKAHCTCIYWQPKQANNIHQKYKGQTEEAVL